MTERQLRVGVVGLAGSWSSEALADAVQRRTGFRLLVDVSSCALDLASGRVMYDGLDLCELDALLIKKLGACYGQDMLDRLELLRFAEERGVAVLSRPAHIIRLLDRLSCTVTLAGGGIPMPATTVTESLDQAVRAVRSYGQAVLKPLYSTKAQGMQLIDGEDADLERRLRAFRDAGNPMLYIQKRLRTPDRDLGVVFMGGEHVGTYARVKGSSSWNTSTREGGHYEAHVGSPEVVALAWRAQALFGLDLTSVDVVETSEGPLVFEVSAFGGFRGSHVALGIDLAERYADYALSRVAP